MSHGSSRGSSRRSSSTTPPRASSSSTTSPLPRIRVPRHVARLITRLVAPLVVDYFTYATRPGASARRATRHAARRRLCRATGCLGTSRGSSRGSSSITSTTSRVRVPRHIVRLVTRLVVDYFDYAACPGASARRASRHAARRRLLRLRRASGCLGTSRGSSSTTSPPPRIRVPRHIARLITRLVVDYFTYAARPVASACRAACHVTHRRLLRLAQARRRVLHLRRASGCVGTSRGLSRDSSSTTPPTPRVRVPRHVAWLITRLVAPLVVDYFTYVVRPVASACRATCRMTHRRLLRLA
jgi:hypothetical protein